MGRSTSKTCQINFNHIFQISSLSKIEDCLFYCSQNPCLHLGLIFGIGNLNSFHKAKHIQTITNTEKTTEKKERKSQEEKKTRMDAVAAAETNASL